MVSFREAFELPHIDHDLSPNKDNFIANVEQYLNESNFGDTSQNLISLRKYANDCLS